MDVPGAPALLVLADDLSGAAETAAVFLSRTTRTELVLGAAAVDGVPAGTDVVVVDLDDREVVPAEAAARTAAALAAGPPPVRVLAKLDSLLRGTVAARVGALRARGGVVVAPALPALGRVVRDGVLTVDGVPLAATRAWATQGTPAPDTVAAALPTLPTVVLDLSTVRSDRLAAALTRAVRAGRVPVCDGERDADLDAVVAAVATASAELPGLALAGSAGVATALAQTRSAASGAPPPPPPRPGAPGPLVVVGSAESTAAAQVSRLVDAGVPELRLPAAELLAPGPAGDEAGHLAAALATGPVVVRPDPAAPVDPRDSRRLAAGLGALAARVVVRTGQPVDLVLTGGETARRVLDALGVDRLTPVGQVHHGAVVSRLPGGSLVVTRPGSFGDPDSLLAILAALHPPQPRTPPLTTASSRGSTEGTP